MRDVWTSVVSHIRSGKDRPWYPAPATTAAAADVTTAAAHPAGPAVSTELSSTVRTSPTAAHSHSVKPQQCAHLRCRNCCQLQLQGDAAGTPETTPAGTAGTGASKDQNTTGSAAATEANQGKVVVCGMQICCSCLP